jgi:hypothetical protein
VVAYTDGKGVWETVDLVEHGKSWLGRVGVTKDTEFFVQVVDRAGNVAVDDNGGAYHTFAAWQSVYLPLVLKGR